EILYELQVVCAVRIHPGLAVAAGVPRVRPGADIPGIHGSSDVQAPRASATADSLRAAVPRSLDAARAAVHGIERQTDADVDLLPWRCTVQHVHLTVRLVRAAWRDDLASHALDDRIALQSYRRIDRELAAHHG